MIGWTLGVASACVSAAVVLWATNVSALIWNQATGDHPAAPLAVSVGFGVGSADVSWQADTDEGWAVPGAWEPARIPRPDGLDGWLRANDGFTNLHTWVTVVVQGWTRQVVVLTGMSVEVLERLPQPAATTFKISNDCDTCAPAIVRRYALDLDRPHPRLVPPSPRPMLTFGPAGPTPTMELALDFPFTVTDTDTEVFNLEASTLACDCRWVLHLEWSSQGKSGSVRIDAGGKPFRTAAAKAQRRYCYNPETRINVFRRC